MKKIEEAVFQRDLAWITTVIQQAQTRRFYGELNIKFENGLIVFGEETQKLKPPASFPGV